MTLRTFKKKIKLRFIRYYRIFSGKSTEINHRRTKNERMIIKIVRGVINAPDSMVHYSHNSSRFFLHTKDKRYIISMDSCSIRITNHHFFFNSDLRLPVADQLISLVFSRIEDDMKELESDSVYNENIFLSEVYEAIGNKED